MGTSEESYPAFPEIDDKRGDRAAVAGEQLGNAVPLLHGHGAAVDKDIADAELSAAVADTPVHGRSGGGAGGGIRCAPGCRHWPEPLCRAR